MKLAPTDDEILTTREIMLQLRPSVKADDYLGIVRRMMNTDGYQLAALFQQDTIRAVAGYRFIELLSAAECCTSTI